MVAAVEVAWLAKDTEIATIWEGQAKDMAVITREEALVTRVEEATWATITLVGITIPTEAIWAAVALIIIMEVT